MRKVLFFLTIMILSFNVISYADEIEEESDDTIIEVSASNSDELVLESKNVLALDRKTLTVLVEKNAYDEVAMASTTKIMTAILVIENCDNFNDIVEISSEAARISGSTLGLHIGQRISINDLLYGLMMRSGNDCAVALAEYISGSVDEFVNLMNAKAKELGLKHTNFVTPHGLDDENHYTTAYELAILTDYALKNDKFCTIVGTKNAIIYIDGIPMEISNTNELLGNCDGVYGVKTGFTFNAGRCLVSSCKRNNMDIIVVVLGANVKKQRTKDSLKIINYIYKNYDYLNIKDYVYEKFENYKNFFEKNVVLEKTITCPQIKIENNANYDFPLKLNDIRTLKSKFYFVNTLSYDSKCGDQIGLLQVYYNDKILCNYNVILANDLVKNDWKYYMKYILKNLKENIFLY